MARLTSGGQGAAPWTATRRLLRSYFRRISSGSFSRRTNIVGTHWLCVTPWRSIAARASSASKDGIITTVPPHACTMPENRSGAAW
jgi:hypothetical protein